MPKREEIRIAALGEPVSHYTEAVRFGDLLYVSGIVAMDPDGNVVGVGDAAAQTRRIFDNMKLILDAVGAGFEDVLKVNVYLRSIEDRPVINPIREEVFGDARPASTLVEVAKLILPDLLVEIEAVVGIPDAS